MHSTELEELWPNLDRSEYRISSPQGARPNCIGWALSDTSQYWDPLMVGVRGYYWLPGVPREDTLRAWTLLFEKHNYEVWDNAEFEPGLEKVAIYADEHGTPMHVARQKGNGRWTSKLGKLEDVEHDNLEGLEGEEFGTVVRVLARTRQGEGVRLG